MKKIIYIFLFILLIGCSNKKEKSKTMGNIIEENGQYINDNTIDNTILSEKYCQYKIDLINIYNFTSKESQYIEIKNEDVFLFKLPENDEWFYCFVSDVIHGFIYIYDISKESFYGNFDDNRKSGNTFRILLEKEYELIKKYPNIKRHGPLLEINYSQNNIKFWDSFLGEKLVQTYCYQLLDYYEGFNEILIRKQLWEGSKHYIYNLQLADYVCEIGDTPYFNKSRNAVFSLEYSYGDPFVDLKLFLINNGKYEKIIDESITLDYYHSTHGFWINNDEFQINYIEKYYDSITNHDGSVSEVLKDKKITLLVSRNNPNFVFEIKR